MKVFFYGMLLPAALSGTAAVLCWLLLKKLCGARFSAAFYKGALVAAVLCFLVPWTVLLPARTAPHTVPATAARQTATAPEEFIAPYSPLKEALGEAMQAVEAENAPQADGAALAAYVWAFAAAGLLVYRMVCYKIFLRGLKKHRSFAERETAELAIGGVKAYRCAAVSGAMTVGFLHPEVYLPPYGPEGGALKYALMHEGAHINSRDTLLKLGLECLCAVYWFCPFIWAARRLFARECEYAADARVARRLDATERKEYGFALLSAVGERRKNAPPFCATGFSVNGKKFQERLERMMKTSKMTMKKKIAAAFCALMLLTAGVLAGCAFAPQSVPEESVTTLPPAAENGEDAQAQPMAGGPKDAAPEVENTEDTAPKPAAEEPQGTEEAQPEGWVWPVEGEKPSLNRGYHQNHPALDIQAEYGAPIAAPLPGKVIKAAYTAKGYGWHVVIEHEGDLSTLFAHCSSLAVAEGDEVEAGQTVAYVGSSGWSTGNHCHFEVRQGGNGLAEAYAGCVDPMAYYQDQFAEE